MYTVDLITSLSLAAFFRSTFIASVQLNKNMGLFENLMFLRVFIGLWFHNYALNLLSL